MPIGVLTENPAGTQETYEAIMRELNLRGAVPTGALLHVAGPMEGGGWRVFDIWESREAMERFYRDEVEKARRKVMGDAAPALEPKVFPIHNLLKAS